MGDFVLHFPRGNIVQKQTNPAGVRNELIVIRPVCIGHSLVFVHPLWLPIRQVVIDSKMKFKAATTIVIAAFVLAVWSSPAKFLSGYSHDILLAAHPTPWTQFNFPAFYNGHPPGFLYPVVSTHPYKRRNYIERMNNSLFGIQSPSILYPVVSGVSHNLKDTSGVQNGMLASRTISDDVIMPSFDLVPRHVTFTDKSFLAFFSKVVMPIRVVNRISTFPNFRVTYKNITLNGIAIG